MATLRTSQGRSTTLFPIIIKEHFFNNTTPTEPVVLQNPASVQSFQLLSVLYIIPVVFVIVILLILKNTFFSSKWKNPKTGTKKYSERNNLKLRDLVSKDSERQAFVKCHTSSYKTAEVQANISCLQKNSKSASHSTKTDVNFDLTQSELLEPNGATYKVGCYTISFPAGAVKTTTQLHFSLGNAVKQSSQSFLIAPVLTCKPCGIHFEKDFAVSVRTGFFSANRNETLVAVNVSVRNDSNAPWAKESSSILGTDGIVTYRANHFSDRAVEVENTDIPNVGRSMATLGFVVDKGSDVKILTWYVFDKLGTTCERILKLHKNETRAISYATFRAKVDRDLVLKLDASDSCVNCSNPQVTIKRETLRSEDSHPSSFDLRRTAASSNEGEQISTLSYRITQEMPDAAESWWHEQPSGSIHLNWNRLAAGGSTYTIHSEHAFFGTEHNTVLYSDRSNTSTMERAFQVANGRTDYVGEVETVRETSIHGTPACRHNTRSSSSNTTPASTLGRGSTLASPNDDVFTSVAERRQLFERLQLTSTSSTSTL